ncbi:MAG: thymidylate synthase [Candidatus Woesearchaeota archaeon]
MATVNKGTTNIAWKSALSQVFQKGKDFTDTDGRVCRELLNFLIIIKNPQKDIDKPIQIMRGFEKWIYPSKEELTAIILNKNYSLGYDYSYGPRIFGNEGKVDQIADFVVPVLKNNKDSRKAGISLYNKEEDSNIKNMNIPSLIYLYFKIRNNKLRCTSIVRSCDLFVGWPANIYQVFCLQEYISEKLGIKPGSLSTFCCSAHIFKEHFEHISDIINK